MVDFGNINTVFCQYNTNKKTTLLSGFLLILIRLFNF